MLKVRSVKNPQRKQLVFHFYSYILGKKDFVTFFSSLFYVYFFIYSGVIFSKCFRTVCRSTTCSREVLNCRYTRQSSLVHTVQYSTFCAAKDAAGFPHSASRPAGGDIPCFKKWNARTLRVAIMRRGHSSNIFLFFLAWGKGPIRCTIKKKGNQRRESAQSYTRAKPQGLSRQSISLSSKITDFRTNRIHAKRSTGYSAANTRQVLGTHNHIN